MKESFNKGNKAYLKGKYGMFYQVVIKKIEDDYAFIQGDKFLVGSKKVRLNRLSKEFSETFRKESTELENEIHLEEELLYKIKNNNK